MARTRVTTTKYEIIRVASDFFLNVGYSNTSPKMIAEELGLSTGNITYYFPTKEHLLAVIVEMICDFQWKMMEGKVDKGGGDIASICLETMTVAAACSENDVARDFFITTFESEMCRNYLRANHVERAKRIFAEYCEGWTDEQFHQAELMVMGLQYAAIVPTDADVPLKTRVTGALNQILRIYNVNEEICQKEIEKVLAQDCGVFGKLVFEKFASFVAKMNKQTLKEMIRGNPRKNKTAVLNLKMTEDI